LNVKDLFDILEKKHIHFFTGVPDSTLKDFSFYLEDHTTKKNHVIAANEGNAIGIASGYFLATGQIPLVYMQNSGFGNSINPITSLADKTVFSIPMLILMGWRGEPNQKDAVQHQKDGQIQLDILESLHLSYNILDSKTSLENDIEEAISSLKINSAPHVLLVRRGTFEKYTPQNSSLIMDNIMSREASILEIVRSLNSDDIVISTTGKASREIYEIRKKLNHNSENDFRVIGSMGHASSIALGINLQISDRKVYCLDGDGSLIMHMGAMSTISKYSNTNFRHILLNNFSHDSVGGQASSSDVINFSNLSKSLSYSNYFKITDKAQFSSTFPDFQNMEGPSFLEIVVSKGSRVDLGRPDSSPKENKEQFMKFLHESKK
jgi:phosphonopyruvate decarboxylase